MNRINWARVVGCGLPAGIVWIILGALVTALLGRDFAALPNNRLASPTAGFVLFNVLLDLLEGISILWLYAYARDMDRARRPRRLRRLRGGSSSLWVMRPGVRLASSLRAR